MIADHLWKHRDLGWIAMQIDALKIDYDVASLGEGSKKIDAESTGPGSPISAKSLPDPTSPIFSKGELKGKFVSYVKSYGREAKRHLDKIDA